MKTMGSGSNFSVDSVFEEELVSSLRVAGCKSSSCCRLHSYCVHVMVDAPLEGALVLIFCSQNLFVQNVTCSINLTGVCAPAGRQGDAGAGYAPRHYVWLRVSDGAARLRGHGWPRAAFHAGKAAQVGQVQ
jgi:hypothetical protein